MFSLPVISSLVNNCINPTLYPIGHWLPSHTQLQHWPFQTNAAIRLSFKKTLMVYNYSRELLHQITAGALSIHTGFPTQRISLICTSPGTASCLGVPVALCAQERKRRQSGNRVVNKARTEPIGHNWIDVKSTKKEKKKEKCDVLIDFWLLLFSVSTDAF